MLILHVSDIHFRSPDCLTPDMDADRPFRTRLIQDAQTMVQKLGPVDAILIGGDIAFKGAPEEYETAFEWIKSLAAATRCAIGRVFVIPGNHDVDRSIAKEQKVREVHEKIADAPAWRKERVLRTAFLDPEDGQSLLAPIAAYNEFAGRFNCQIYPPERLFWKQDIDLTTSIKLRIYGLTSTILSGRDGLDDGRDLYLSPLQTGLDPVEDVVRLVMCHHPPDWLMDGDDANDAISGRAPIHVFGHKHRQRILREHDFIRFSAGAVNPDRQEAGWNPGYNLFELDVEGEGKDRRLLFKAHLRQWQTNPDLFKPMLTSQREEVFHHSVAFPGAENAIVLDPGGDVPGPAKLPEAAKDVEAAMGDESTRNLVFRFWNLSVSQRRTIAQNLGLLEDGEIKLPEPERYGRVLRRAGERGLLEKLAYEVSQVEI